MPQSLATPLTIEARIYPRSYVSAGSAVYLLWLHQDFDTEWSLYYASGANDPQVFAPQASPLLSVADWANYITANTWHSLKITVNTNGLSQLYIDGTPRGSSSVVPNYGRTNNWTLHMGDFDGDIDEVRISNALR